ncbi:competence protein [Maritimibacter sp. 55A14]|uniref:ComEC/Rec2 family competence protein n=1 Tax=Maritimibacter sp. 55A14 TaxID=2174844 RepID=UPI000D61D99D|nr:ComEC/Rec2 family competence protein [Maritimibacter sp. 55A14]PWE34283.1 competence protein [Maritimibacter sp. 55A14]
MRTSLAPLHFAALALLRQRGRLFPWVPVMMACGIGFWFGLGREPEPGHYAAAAAAGLCAALLALRVGPAAAPIAAAVALAVLGFLLAGFRAHDVAAPVLGFRYYGPVEGRVVALDRSFSNRPRVTLDRVVLSRVDPDATPGRVRISLHGETGLDRAVPGARVITTAHLSPPSGPVEPGGFDFRRLAWFEGLGAVGYTRSPMLGLTAPAPDGWRPWVFALRMRLSEAIRAQLPGRSGGFAAAIVTGDRSAVESAVLEDLRASNLAHLLAISGLHMGLLTGFVFAGLRAGIALVPPLALRVPGKKLAAAAALPVAFAYLLISGASVATERAFIMVAVMLLAVLLDRRALTLRAVAMAAMLVLALRPESLVTAGFQMSFAATTALVAVFGALRNWQQARPEDAWRMPRWLRPALAVLISSAVAGAATAPIAAVHFNQMSQYGLLANLASVPVMGMVVMPAAVLAFLLWPLGLAGPGFAAMGAGIDWILGVAHRVAGWEGAVIPVVKPGGAVLPLLAAGALVVVLWQGRLRLAGLLPVLLAATFWLGAERPEILISETGKLTGVMGSGGRVLSKPRGEGFAARSWLENDGDLAAQEDAATRREPPDPVLAVFDGAPEPAMLAAACAAEALVLVPETVLDGADCAAVVVDKNHLRALGAIAAHRRDGGGYSFTGARPLAGDRLWTRGTGRREAPQ